MLSAAVTYTVDGQSWTQHFTAEILDDSQVREEGEAVGLHFDSWVDEDRTWARFVARHSDRATFV